MLTPGPSSTATSSARASAAERLADPAHQVASHEEASADAVGKQVAGTLLPEADVGPARAPCAARAGRR